MTVTPPKCSICGHAHWGNTPHKWGPAAPPPRHAPAGRALAAMEVATVPDPRDAEIAALTSANAKLETRIAELRAELAAARDMLGAKRPPASVAPAEAAPDSESPDERRKRLARERVARYRAAHRD